MYKNTALYMRGREDSDWSEYLYTRGSKSGVVTLAPNATGLYVKVNPYKGIGNSYNGAWDFEACKSDGKLLV